MNWLDTASDWFISLATSPAAPYLLVSALAFAFAILVLAIRVWLDMQDTKALADYHGHVPPRQWPADFVDTQPVIEPEGGWPHARPAPSNPVQRPLHTAKVPPVIKNLGDSPIYVNFEGGASKECCGACDGSKCDTDPHRQVAERTQADVITTVAMPRPARAQVPPRRNPQRPNLSRANFDAAFRPRPSASDDEPYRGSYYGQAVSQVMNGEAPAPTPAPAFKSGRGGDFGGAGASGSWDEPARSSSPAPSPSYDSGCSSSSDSGSSSCSSD